MKTFKFTAFVTVDETNINCPQFEDMKLAIEESLNTMDNKEYGISDIIVTGEEVENF
jgi:hypothetical protein